MMSHYLVFPVFTAVQNCLVTIQFNPTNNEDLACRVFIHVNLTPSFWETRYLVKRMLRYNIYSTSKSGANYKAQLLLTPFLKNPSESKEPVKMLQMKRSAWCISYSAWEQPARLQGMGYVRSRVRDGDGMTLVLNWGTHGKHSKCTLENLEDEF